MKQNRVLIHQTKYAKELIKKFKMNECNSMNTLLHSTYSLDKDQPDKKVGQKTFRAMIGSLQYLTASRPDIMFSVCVSGFRHIQKNPT